MKRSTKIFLGTGAVLGGLITVATLIADKYHRLIEGEVIEEKHVRTLNAKGEVDKDHYVLYLEVEEKDKNKNPNRTVYTLNVVENSRMPLAVLDDIIETGSIVWFEYLKPGVLWTSPEFTYPIGRFGPIESIDLKVVTAAESSGEVRKKLGEELDERREIERLRARAEVNEFYRDILIW